MCKQVEIDFVFPLLLVLLLLLKETDKEIEEKGIHTERQRERERERSWKNISNLSRTRFVSKVFFFCYCRWRRTGIPLRRSTPFIMNLFNFLFAMDFPRSNMIIFGLYFSISHCLLIAHTKFAHFCYMLCISCYSSRIVFFFLHPGIYRMDSKWNYFAYELNWNKWKSFIIRVAACCCSCTTMSLPSAGRWRLDFEWFSLAPVRT